MPTSRWRERWNILRDIFPSGTLWKPSWQTPEAAALVEEHAAALFGSMAKSMKNMSGSMGMAAKMSLQNIIQLSGSGLDEKGLLYLNQQFNKIKK